MPDGLRLKLQIANDEIDQLEPAIHAFITDGEIHRVRFQQDEHTGEEFHVASVKQPPDAAWGVKVGCITHLLRSVLDNLVWQLALLQTTTPYERGSYPIFLKRRDKRDPHKSFEGRALNIPKKGRNRGKVMGTLQSVRRTHRAMIEGTQPYRRGNGGTKDPLWSLSQLNNLDKHRLITVVSMSLRSVNIQPVIRQKPLFIGFHFEVRTAPFVDGAELARFPGPLKSKPSYSASVVFGDTCAEVAGLGVIKTLRAMHKRVNGIVDLFTNEF